MMRVKQAQGEAAHSTRPRPDTDRQPGSGDRVLMRLGPGERFFKFYRILSPAGTNDEPAVEHRIITKEHADGTLEMVSYNAWLTNGHYEKSDVIRVPSLSKALLEQIVQRVRAQSDLPSDAFHEIDLSRCATIEEQLHVLAEVGF